MQMRSLEGVLSKVTCEVFHQWSLEEKLPCGPTREAHPLEVVAIRRRLRCEGGPSAADCFDEGAGGFSERAKEAWLRQSV